MRVVEACSAAAARGAAFARSHSRPRITKVHSEAAYAAPAQSPSAALIGYDGTALCHHAAYAASYTARSATWQATPLATPGAVSTRQRLDMLNGGFQEQARKSRREISFACDAIMYEQYVILYCTNWAHLSGTQRPCMRPPRDIKGRCSLYTTSHQEHTQTRAGLSSKLFSLEQYSIQWT